MKVNSCIRNLLKLICLLQNNSQSIACLDDSCTRPFLGPSINGCCYNTRVITLYNKAGDLFTTDYLDNGNFSNSSTFRVQKVDDNCCTLLILSNENGEFVSTKQTITIKLSCICAIKCLGDFVVNNL